MENGRVGVHLARSHGVNAWLAEFLEERGPCYYTGLKSENITVVAWKAVPWWARSYNFVKSRVAYRVHEAGDCDFIDINV